MRKGATKKAAEGPVNRVHRPHLTPAAQQLAAQYRPQEDCRCGQEGREWFMESPRAGEDLEFYCRGCGVYRMVPQV